jgi:hypothetical protein
MSFLSTRATISCFKLVSQLKSLWLKKTLKRFSQNLGVGMQKTKTMFIIIDKYGGTSYLNESTEKQIAEISIAF